MQAKSGYWSGAKLFELLCLGNRLHIGFSELLVFPWPRVPNDHGKSVGIRKGNGRQERGESCCLVFIIDGATFKDVSMERRARQPIGSKVELSCFAGVRCSADRHGPGGGGVICRFRFKFWYASTCFGGVCK